MVSREAVRDIHYTESKRFKFIRTILFFLSLILIGLKINIFIGYVLLFFIYIITYKTNKDEFLIQTLILTYSFNIISDEALFGIKSYDVIIPLIIIVFLLKFLLSKIINKYLFNILIIYIFFLSVNLVIAFLSEERLLVQIRGLRHYLGFFFCLFPFIIYNKNEFDIQTLFKEIAYYWYFFAVFIILQGFFFHNPIFFTNNPRLAQNVSYLDIDFSKFGGLEISRIYPYAFGLVIFCIYYWRKFSKYSFKDIILTILAFLGSLTRSLIIAILVVLLFDKKAIKRIKYFIIAVISFTVLYFVDVMTKIDLRVASFLNQFTSLFQGDYISLGTGRYLQALAPLTTFLKNCNIFIGTGYIHPWFSKNPLYFSPSFIGEDHFITQIEVCPITYFIITGIVGSIALYGFLFFLYWYFRKFKYGGLIKEIEIFFLVIGIAGFWSFLYSMTWGLLGLAVGIILLSNERAI